MHPREYPALKGWAILMAFLRDTCLFLQIHNFIALLRVCRSNAGANEVGLAAGAILVRMAAYDLGHRWKIEQCLPEELAAHEAVGERPVGDAAGGHELGKGQVMHGGE